jgi:hypothetical protein
MIGHKRRGVSKVKWWLNKDDAEQLRSNKVTLSNWGPIEN